MKKVFISTGEVSGDHYGALLASGLKEIDPSITIYGIGGKEMQKSGVDTIFDIKDIEAMGFVEVLSKLTGIYRIIKETSRFIIRNDIDLFIPIDNPDFNFRVIKRLKGLRTKVFYYIPPQVWAWRKKRVFFLKRHVDKTGVIFPFEKDFYSKYGINAVYEGHPLAERYIEGNMDLDKLKDRFMKIKAKEIEFNLAILPGSRETEIDAILPVLIETHRYLKNTFPLIRSHIPVSPNVSREFIMPYISDIENDIILHDNVDEVFAFCDFALIASGTATLQACLYPIPYLLVYKMHKLSFIIAKFFAKLNKAKFIGICNIIADKLIIPEYIQGQASPEKLAEAVESFVSNFEKVKDMIGSFLNIRKTLYRKGSIRLISREIYSMLDKGDISDEALSKVF